jgi:hypothetical protein
MVASGEGMTVIVIWYISASMNWQFHILQHDFWSATKLIKFVPLLVPEQLWPECVLLMTGAFCTTVYQPAIVASVGTIYLRRRH